MCRCLNVSNDNYFYTEYTDTTYIYLPTNSIVSVASAPSAKFDESFKKNLILPLNPLNHFIIALSNYRQLSID